jgi:peroxiredoxin
MRVWILMLAAMCVLSLSAAADDVTNGPPVRPAVPPSGSRPVSPGPHGKAPIIGEVYIGEMAPDFVVDGSKGREEQLSKQRGQWLVLLFADRYRDLATYNTLDIAARKYGARVVCVCHEKQQTLTASCARDHIDMLLMADATGEVSATYGLYDWGEAQTEPGFFVIDREGMVRLAIIGKLFPPDQMLELVRFATGAVD